MGATNLIDVASYQGTSFNPSVLKNTYGINKISMKFTQGNNYINPYAQAQYNMTVQAGSIPMPYHYTVANGYDQAYEEAQFFISCLRNYGVPYTAPIMLDLEDNTYITQSSSIINGTSNGWSNALSNAGYNNQILYMPASWFISYFDSNLNKIKKTWGAQYLYSQQNYYNEPNLSTHNWYDIWQFASTWGNKFPNGYWGGNGLDVSHDYTNAVSYLNDQTTITSTTTKKEEEYKLFKRFNSSSTGILTFANDDAKSKNTKFGKGTSWAVFGITKDNGYILSPNDIVAPSQDVVFYYQPSPYNPDNYKTASGKNIIVTKDVKEAQVYTEPTDDLTKNHAQKEDKDWKLDDSMAYKVGSVENKFGTVWLQVATNAYLRIQDIDFVI